MVCSLVLAVKRHASPPLSPVLGESCAVSSTLLLGEARSKITTHDIAQLKQTMVSRIKKKETKTAGLEKVLQPVTDYIDALYAKIKTTDDKGRPVINIDFARYPFSVDGESHFYISDPENVVVDIEKLAEWFQQIRDSLDGLYYMYSDEWENA